MCFGQRSPSGAGSSPGVKAGVSPLPPAIFCGNFSVRQRNPSLSLSAVYMKSVVFSRDWGGMGRSVIVAKASLRRCWGWHGCAITARLGHGRVPTARCHRQPQQSSTSPATRSPLRLLGCHPAGVCSAKGQARWSESPSCPWHWEL